MRNLVVGNWKMNTALSELDSILAGMPDCACEVVICPPATLIAHVHAHVGDRIAVGGQTAHHAEKGMHTGDLSAQMLYDVGARYVILGHSERRSAHGESDAVVAAQLGAAQRAQLCPIICVGESHDAREAGQAMDVVGAQLLASLQGEFINPKPLVIAYEPVWAIGTGLVPEISDIDMMHHFIRQTLSDRFGATGAEIRILYGGSMNAKNAAAIADVCDVNGGLIGGASLRAADFMPIVEVFS